MIATFPDPIQPKEHLTYRKGDSRKRALTGKEAADAKEIDQARARREAAVETEKLQDMNR